MFNLLVATLPETSLAQVMDIINNIPAVNPFKVLKLRLLEAHMLSDQERMNALFQLGPLGDCQPSQLLVDAVGVPFGHGTPAGLPVPLPSAVASDGVDAAWQTGLW
jgi:hypothetical protein